MGLETATYIDSLVVTNPDGTDQKSTADDHLRLLKACLRRTFSGIAGDVSISHGEANLLRSLTVNVQAEFTRIRTNPSNNGTVAYAVIANSAQSASYAQSASLAALATLALTANSASYAALAGFANTCTSASSAQLLAGNAAAAFALASHAHGNGDLTGYTAADVLSKLLTVDGAGSGLDADLLDGNSSAAFFNSGNQNAGTLPDARVAASNVTQHQAALAIAAGQITAGTLSKTVMYSIAPQKVSGGVAMFMASTNNISGGAITITSTTPTVVFGSPGDIQLVCGPL